MSAQTYRFETYSVGAGLPTDAVYGLYQDRQGYLWFATENGVCRYDGAGCTVFGVRQGLVDPIARSVFEDAEGRIWMTTEGGISRYDGTRFVNYTTAAGLPDNSVYAGLAARDGTLWFGTGKGLVHYDGVRFTTYAEASGLPAGPISRLLEDPEGNIWMGLRGGGLARLDRTRITAYGRRQGLPDETVFGLAVDPAGGLWIGTNGGLSHFDKTGFRTYTRADGLPTDHVGSVLVDRLGRVWCATFGGGLARLENGRFRTFDRTNGLPDNYLTAILQDYEGDIWCATRSSGVVRLSDERFAGFTAASGLVDGKVTGIAETPDGTLWFASVNGGLATLDAAGRVRRFGPRDGLPQEGLWALYADSRGRVWASGYQAVYRFDGRGFHRFSLEEMGARERVTAIIEDREGAMWFGSYTATATGLIRYDGRRFTRLGKEGFEISGFAVDRAGHLWIAGYRGLARLGGKDFRRFGAAQGLRSPSVNCVHEDARGQLWVGTDAGLCRFAGRCLATYTAADGLASDVVRTLISRAGELWVGTAGGLSVFDGARFRNYTTRDGLVSDAFSTGVVHQARDGSLWFGTNEGAVRYRPEPEIAPPVAPRVHVTDIRTDDRDLGMPPSPLDNHENLTLDFLALSFRDEAAVRYSHRLEGFDRSWAPPGIQRSARYTNLPPGRYTFELKAASKGGVWSNPFSVAIAVRRPFWQTWWFGLLALSAFVGLGRGIGLYLEPKRAASSLRASQARQGALVQAIPDLMFRLSKAGVFLDYKADNVADLAVPPERFLGRVIEAVLPAELARQTRAAIERALGSGATQVFEYEIPVKGSPRDYEARVVVSAEGEAFIIARDITERKRAERALRQSEERSRAIVKTAHDAFIAMDTAGRIADWSPQAEALFGWSGSEVVGTSLARTIIPTRYREEHARGLKRFVETGEGPILGQRLEWTALHRDGHEFPVELTISAVPSGDTHVFYAFVHDIGARKRAEALRATQFAVAQILAESPTLATAIPRLVEALGEGLGAALVQLWLVDPALDRLRWAGLWKAPGVSAAAFEEASRTIAFERGIGLPGRVWESGEPAWIPDVVADPNFPRAEAAAREGLHGAFAFPIAGGTGVIEFFHREVRSPDAPLLELGGDIGRRIGQFAERRRAEEALRRRNEHLAALNETSLDLMNRLELDDLLKAILTRAGQLLGTNFGNLYLVTPAGAEAEKKVRLGQAVADDRLKPGEGLSGTVWKTGQPMAVEDYDAWEGQLPRVPRGLYGAVAAVPFKSGGEVVGVIDMAYEAGSGRSFGETEMQLLSGFAQLASIAVDNARLFERERAAREQAERLRSATRALTATMDLPRVLDLILSELEKVVPYDRASVQELKGERLEIIGVRGAGTDGFVGHSFDVGAGDDRNQQVLSRREPVILDAAPYVDGIFGAGAEPAGSRSWMGVPLLFADRLIGMLALNNNEPGFYTAEHAHLAWGFASQAAIAMENARLYTAVQSELTERKRAQAALEASEARYREVVESAADVIYRIDTAGRFTYVNPATQHIFGFSEAELTGRNFLEVIRPDWRETAAEFYRDQYWNLVPHTYQELPVLAKDGRELWLGCSLQLLLDEGGMPRGFQAISRDITERKQAELSLKLSEERIRAIVETAHSAFVAVDGGGRILEWNPSAERIFGWSREEALGQPLAETLVPPRHREAYGRGIEQFLATGASPVLDKRLEVSALRRDGQEITVEFTASSVGAREAPILHAFAQDVTDRKLLERLREDLTHTMVHDLRNPLTSIMGSLEFLELSGELSAEQRETLRLAEANSRRLLGLVGAILEVSRLESGALPLEREHVGLATLAAEVLELQRPAAAPKDLRLVGDLPSGLPDAWVDRSLVGRVLQNLIGNAIKFTPEGGVIRVEVRQDESEAALLRVGVSDTGLGIPDELRGRLFQKFVAGRQPGRGTGLGLAFCRLAVEAHGGRIWAESEPGGGSKFLFTLPTVSR